MEETELIKLCIQKNILAWNEFVTRYSGLVYWAIKNKLKKWDYLYHPEDIEEIHQNVFFALWGKNKLEQLKDHSKIASWLVIISGNEAIDYLRYQKAQTPPKAISLFENIMQKDKTLTIADTLSAKEPSPSSLAEINEIEKILEDTINGLSAKERIIIKLNLLYNKKYREISEILHMPVGSVSTAVKNIKLKLKKRLKEKIQTF